MANLAYKVGSKYASWFHPMWKKVGGICVDADTTEVVAGIDAGTITWLTDAGHGWSAGNTYASGSRIELSSGVLETTNYVSLQDNNIGHNPTSSPTWWEVIDDGLGADDEHWITVNGLLRPDCGQDANGKHYVHMYARPSGISGAYWDAACSPGQWSMAAGGSANPMPAVRMVGSADTCYYALTNDQEADFFEATIYKVIAGVSTQIAYGYVSKATDAGNQSWMIYAVGDIIGVARTLVDTPDTVSGWPMYPNAQEVVVTVTDTSIPLATGPYVGVRAVVGDASIHEWYGGSFSYLGVTSETVVRNTVTLTGTRPPGTTITITT